MRQALTFLALVGIALPAAAQENTCKKCGSEKYGTTIVWADSPSDAAKKAKEEQKLVFVLHVSGHFEDPKFT